MYRPTFTGSHLRAITEADDDDDMPDTTVQPLGRHIANYGGTGMVPR